MNTWVTALVAVLGLLGGGTLVQLVTVRKTATKLSADTDLSKANAAETLIQAAVELVGPLKSELADAKKLVGELKSELEAAQGEVAQLRSQVDYLTKDVQAKQAELDSLHNSPLNGDMKGL